jgi:diacylglycerol kinase family enzyme
MSSLQNQSSQGRSAFLLNANAKSVGGVMLNKLIEMVPTGDLYLSHSFQDSEKYLHTILNKGYNQIVSGGGDGTLVNTVTMLHQIKDKEGSFDIPQIGVLRLGTGNAVASILGAQRPLIDANHILSGGRADTRTLNMLRCEDGKLAPFAGIGLDGEVLNDYMDLKESSAGRLSERLVRTLFGYVWAGLTRTAVRHIRKEKPIVRVTTKNSAIKMVTQSGVDVELKLPANSVLYEGPASMVSVGSIPCFGYGFQMFPFLKGRTDPKLQVRVCAAGVLPILANLYPSLWKGTYRGDHVFDFLVDQVTIESEENMPYQVAGDARGYRKQMSFTLAQNCVQAVELDKNRVPYRRGVMGLLPAHAFAR